MPKLHNKFEKSLSEFNFICLRLNKKPQSFCQWALSLQFVGQNVADSACVPVCVLNTHTAKLLLVFFGAQLRLAHINAQVDSIRKSASQTFN